MTVIIAGPRTFYPLTSVFVQAVAHCGFPVEKIISGGADGVDRQAKRFAQNNELPFAEFKADWDKYGRKAGPIRNHQMAQKADALIVIKKKGEETPGTANMIRTAEKRGMPIYIEEVD